MADAWDLLSKGSWLHGVKESSHMHDDDSSTQPPRKRKKDHKGAAASPAGGDDHQQRIDSIKHKFHEKHGSMFTPMQYRGWAELLAINSHSCYDSPPPYPMFNGGRSTRNKSSTSEIAAAFTTMAHAFAGNLQPRQLLPPASTTASTSTSTAATTSGASPGRIADLRAKYIQQIKELHSLFESGALTETEFLDQKRPVLEQLKKFNL